MEMKYHLIDTFRFNDEANRKMISKIHTLPEKKEAVRYMSHLINSQIKWLARIHEYPNNPNLDWWLPEYAEGELESRWTESVNRWINYLESLSEAQLFEQVRFIGKDGGHWSAPLKDIALQLNYHSFHHRAQIQMLIRAQGIEPDFIDYIGTKYKKLHP
jgi:uncharacterized damage-inducible protein DinB